MRISLSEIVNLKGALRETDCMPEASEFLFMGRVYPYKDKQPVHIKLSAKGAKEILLEAHINLSFVAECDRCLEEVIIPFSADITHLLKMNEDGTATADDDDEKVSYIDAYELDVDDLVDEEVMIGFPMKVLCKEDCKGICSTCGANLNRGECGCDRTVLDPRMSIIRDLFQQKEV